MIPSKEIEQPAIAEKPEIREKEEIEEIEEESPPEETTTLLEKENLKYPTTNNLLYSLRELLHYLTKCIILGGSLKVGLDVYLESYIYDISNAGVKDFDKNTIATIGAYLAAISILMSYIIHRKLANADITNKLNLSLYKLIEAIDAWGLHGYIMTFFLFLLTENCRMLHKSHIIKHCQHEALPLNTFCCTQEITQNGHIVEIVRINDLTFIMSALLAFLIARLGSPLVRRELNTMSCSKAAFNIISPFIAASIFYFIVKFIVNPEYALYNTVTPIITYHIFYFLWTISNITAPIEMPLNQTRISFGASLIRGIGFAALLHGLVTSWAMYFVPDSALHELIHYGVPFGLSLAVSFYAIKTKTLTEFICKIASSLFPINYLSVLIAPVLIKLRGKWGQHVLNCLSGTTIAPNKPINTDQAITAFLTHLRQPIKLARATIASLATFTMVFFSLDQLKKILIPADPYDITAAAKAGLFRFIMELIGLLILGSQAYGKRINIRDMLKISWPNMASITITALLSIDIYESIARAAGNNGANEILLITLMLSFCAICIAGFIHGMSYRPKEDLLAENNSFTPPSTPPISSALQSSTFFKNTNYTKAASTEPAKINTEPHERSPCLIGYWRSLRV